MLPDTSNARITVPSTRGTLMTLCGRAIAITSMARPTRMKADAIRRRRPTNRAGTPADAEPVEMP